MTNGENHYLSTKSLKDYDRNHFDKLPNSFFTTPKDTKNSSDLLQFKKNMGAKSVSCQVETDDASMLPIFHKLLSERKDISKSQATITSCPNITIKCDIVEYL